MQQSSQVKGQRSHNSLAISFKSLTQMIVLSCLCWLQYFSSSIIGLSQGLFTPQKLTCLYKTSFSGIGSCIFQLSLSISFSLQISLKGSRCLIQFSLGILRCEAKYLRKSTRS